MVSPCVQGMGEHWLNPKTVMLADGVLGPIYGSYHGRAIFTEISVPVKTFQKGFNYRRLTALPGYTINHVDVEYHPHGHEGMPIPHYDIHAYYVSHITHMKMCPNGVPDPIWKKTGRSSRLTRCPKVVQPFGRFSDTRSFTMTVWDRASFF